MMYALNDFDDSYSVSDAVDMSMLSGSYNRGLQLMDSNQRMPNLVPTNQVMREMEANALR